MTRRMSAILGEYSPAGQGCTRHFSVPPLEYKNSTSYKKYRPDFGLIPSLYERKSIPNYVDREDPKIHFFYTFFHFVETR